MAQSLQDKLAQVSFSDGSIEQINLIGDEAQVTFRDWREQVWSLRFQGVIFFQSYEFGGDVSEVQVSNEMTALAGVIAAIERNGGDRAGYPGLVSVRFLGDSPMITVVCQNLDIAKSVAT